MLHITPTYTYRTEASLTPSPSPARALLASLRRGRRKDEGSFVACEALMCTIGGGNASRIFLSDYSELYSLLQALCMSASSRFF